MYYNKYADALVDGAGAREAGQQWGHVVALLPATMDSGLLPLTNQSDALHTNEFVYISRQRTAGRSG